RERGEFCDVSLRLNGRYYPAHKAVLAASSPYFRSMFTSHMREHSSPEVDLSESMQLENDRTFKRVLRFMYSGDIEINIENVDDVLRLADFLLLDEVREYCHQFYLRHGNITPANALGLAELAERHNLPEVARVAKAIVAARFHDCIVQRDEILEVSVAGLRELLGDDNITQFISSDALIQLLMRWTRHDPIRRQQDMLRLLPYVRLTCLSCDSL
ncbi:Kelch-like protein 12, partial [Lamellibrachia satsuma]